METLNLLTLMSIAFLGSFGHCVGMCGGIVLAYSTIKIEPQSSKVSKGVSHLLYSFGRVLTYTLLGAAFGALGSVVVMSNSYKGVFFIIVGLLMIFAGLSLMGKLRFLTLIEHSFSKSALYKYAFKKILNSKSNSSFFTLGMLNGLLPCGFVYFFAITAAGTASPFYGALVMFIFGVSTIPAMFSIGFLTSLASSTSFRNMMMSLSSVAVLIYGSLTIYHGYNFIFKAPKEIHHCH